MDFEYSDESRLLTESELKREHAFLLELSNVTVEMLNHTDINELFQSIVEKLLRISHVCMAYIAIEHESGEYLDIKHVAPADTKLKITKLKPQVGIGGSAWAENQIIYSSDYQAFSNKIAYRFDFSQACAIPLSCKEGNRGVICIFSNNSTADIKGQISLLKKYTQVASAALDNAVLHEIKMTELSMLEAMMKFNLAINQSTAYIDIVDSICKVIVEGFNVNRARVYSYSNGRFGNLAGRIGDEENSEVEELPSQTILAESANMWSVQNLLPAHVKVGIEDKRESPRVHKHRFKSNIGCSYIVPLIRDNEATGVLSVHKPIGELDFTPHEKRLIDVLSSQLSSTINRQHLMQEIEYQANYDQLTGCLCRKSFEAILNNAIENAHKLKQEFTLLYVDLDDFKKINDTLGHEAGDIVLKHVAKNIKDALAEDMHVARLGGDEFAVLIPPKSNQDRGSELAKKLGTALSTRKHVSPSLPAVHASIGIAKFPQHGENSQQLLNCADIAMYHAKGLGAGQIREYDADFGAKYKRRRTLQNRIDAAIANNEFELHYQPKVSVSDGKVLGAEALIRWNEPEFSNVSPAEWIPLAEETGCINKIGYWVAAEAIRFYNQLRKQNINIKLSMNISATQFEDIEFPGKILDLLRKSAVPGSAFEFEITETAVINDIDVAVAKLQQIREEGVTIAIDDFGVEYSSLAYLGDLPIDVLKIDRLFVKRMNDSKCRSMIKPILVLANSLGLDTVVEGVETVDQLNHIISLGGHCIQGYYFSKPVSENNFPEVIRELNQLLESKSQLAA